MKRPVKGLFQFLNKTEKWWKVGMQDYNKNSFWTAMSPEDQIKHYFIRISSVHRSATRNLYHYYPTKVQVLDIYAERRMIKIETDYKVSVPFLGVIKTGTLTSNGR